MELFYRFSKVVVVAGLIIGISMPAAEAYQVYGAIGEKWRQLGAETGPLGAPSSDERDAARGGRFNEFQHGFIYWNGRDGAHAVYGTIGEKWKQLGRETGALGYPLTDELPGTNGGRFNNFESGVIYWRPNYGAYAVYGHIGEKWIALGRESGICGYPTSDEYDFDDNRYTGEYGIGKRFRRSDFTNGYILWSKHRDQTYVSCSGASSNPPPTSAPRISVEFDRFFGQSLATGCGFCSLGEFVWKPLDT